MSGPSTEPKDHMPWCKHAAERDAWGMVGVYERDNDVGLDDKARRGLAREFTEALVRWGDYGEECRRGCDDE